MMDGSEAPEGHGYFSRPPVKQVHFKNVFLSIATGLASSARPQHLCLRKSISLLQPTIHWGHSLTAPNLIRRRRKNQLREGREGDSTVHKRARPWAGCSILLSTAWPPRPPAAPGRLRKRVEGVPSVPGAEHFHLLNDPDRGRSPHSNGAMSKLRGSIR